MPAEHGPDELDRWLDQQVQPLPPPPGTFEMVTRRARRRKVRRALVSAATAGAVAAVIAIAVPLSSTLHLTTTPARGELAAGSSPTQTRPAQRSDSNAGGATASSSPSSAAAPSGTATGPDAEPSGPVPAHFIPSSVTFVDTSTGWVLGQAGTPGSCQNANPDICTSIARTDNAGKSWAGGPAPDAGAPDNATGVSGIRFLDGVNGWAFGPELWVTHDAGRTWTQQSTGGARVTDLETANGRAYALFATCGDLNTADPGIDWANCTSYTLMTTVASSDAWSPVSGATSGLTDGGLPTSGYITLSGGTGYLVAPDGSLYSGPIGGTWTKAGTLPCQPGNANYTTGQAGQAQLAAVGPTELATFCGGHTPTAAPQVYTSADGGATWTLSAAQWTTASREGAADSITATSDGTIVLGTLQGIVILPAGATAWQAATINGSLAVTANGLTTDGGFSYVGMTSATQGIALSDAPSSTDIWLTFDGGRTWTPSPIK